MGLEEIIINVLSTSFVDSEYDLDYFWYIFITICPGYVAGFLLFYIKDQKFESWFDKSVFDKTIISILFGGLLIILTSLIVKAYYYLRGIELTLEPEGLSIFISLLLGLIAIFIAFLSWKRSDEDKLIRRLNYESRKYPESANVPLSGIDWHELIEANVAVILSKYYDDYVFGKADEPDIAIPNFEAPKIFIEIKSFSHVKAIKSAINQMKNLKEKFPESKFIFITDFKQLPVTKPRLELLSEFDAFFDINTISKFDRYLKELD